MSSKILRGAAAVHLAPWISNRAIESPRPYHPEAHTHAVEAEPVDQERVWQQRVQQAEEQGRRAGEAAAQQRFKAQTDAAVAQLGKAVAELAGYKDRIRRDAERDVVMLAMAVAKRLLYREINVDPDALSGVIRAALDKISAREVHRVRVANPHCSPVQQALERIGAPQRIEVIADSALEPGAIIFETVKGNFDASIGAQLNEIERGFVDLMSKVDLRNGRN